MPRRSMAGVRTRTRAAVERVMQNRRANRDVPAANLAGTRGDTVARRRAEGMRAAQAQTERQQRQQQRMGMDTRTQKLLYNPTTNRYRAVSRNATVPRGYQTVEATGATTQVRGRVTATGVYRNAKKR